MFIHNKYWRIYNNICTRARSRKTADYTERHHIIPKSLGGTLQKENLVRLTAREHYIAHLCLVRCTAGDAQRKMICAVHMFRHLFGSKITKHNASIFEANRIQMSLAVAKMRRGQKHSALTKQKISKKALGHRRNVGFKHSETTKHLWSRLRKGRRPSDAAIESLRKYAKLPKSEEWKSKMRAVMKGNRNSVGCKRSEAHKQAIAEYNKRRWQDPEFVRRWNERKAQRATSRKEV